MEQVKNELHILSARMAALKIAVEGMTAEMDLVTTNALLTDIKTLNTALNSLQTSADGTLDAIAADIALIKTDIADLWAQAGAQEPVFETNELTLGDIGYGQGVRMFTLVQDDPIQYIGAIALGLYFTGTTGGPGTIDLEVFIPMVTSQLDNQKALLYRLTQLNTSSGVNIQKQAYLVIPCNIHALIVKIDYGSSYSTLNADLEITQFLGPAPHISATNDWVDEGEPLL